MSEGGEMTNRNEFFKTLDGTMGKTVEDEDALFKAKRELRARFDSLVSSSFEPTLRAYAADLTSRGIRNRVTPSESGLALRLEYGSGARHELRIGWDQEKGGVYFSESSPDPSGQFQTTEGIPGLQVEGGLGAAHLGVKNEWSDNSFEERLQRFIESHIFYADRNGGIVKS